MKLDNKCRLFDDIYNAIYEDDYMYIVVWGPPRCSKTTLAEWMLYSIYEDWDKVLQATVFNLAQVIHRIKSGLPDRYPTKNGLHRRVPILNWDDFGAHSNKAVTQYSEAWDLFKGGSDTLGTKLAVLVTTMCDPTEPTFQLMNKYTHEVQILGKGQYKYDLVEWQQDFRGFRPRSRKRFIEQGTFDKIPDEVYRDYDGMRRDLTDEVLVRIEDALTLDHLEITMKLIKPSDEKLLRLIDTLGPIEHQTAQETLQDEYKHTITRCKARSLIIPIAVNKGYYKYELTMLGKDVLTALDKRTIEQANPQEKTLKTPIA